MFSVEQIREDIAPFTLDAGKCKESEFVLKYINGARRLLWPRANFKGTLETICIKTDGTKCFLTLPANLMRIVRAQRCGRDVQIDTPWYEYADNVSWGDNCASSLLDLGERYTTFEDYGTKNFRLKIKAESNQDVGKKVHFGIHDENDNRRIITGVLSEDHVGVSLNEWIKYYHSVTKERTVGRVRVYIYDPNAGVETICAIYEPEEINPIYRRYRLPRGNRSAYYFIEGKKRYRPLVDERQMVEFNTDAMIQACIALTHRRNKKLGEYTAALNLAMEHENQELKQDKQETGGRIRLSRQRENTNLIAS